MVENSPVLPDRWIGQASIMDLILFFHTLSFLWNEWISIRGSLLFFQLLWVCERKKKKKEKLQTKSLVCVLIGMGMKKQLYEDQQGKKSAGERLV